jgi:hypothetical protein
MNSIEDFERLSAQWHDETGHLSNLTKMVGHPAYQQIIGLGPDVLPLLLRSLEQAPDHWFWALASITGEDAAAGEQTVEGARQKWLSWGREHALLA